MSRLHLAHVPSWSTRPMARCGLNSENLTDDPGQVTCLTCEKRLDADLEPVDERIDREALQKARNWARSRAVTELVARHEAEFEALWAGFTAELLDEARAVVEADIAARERWEAQRIAKRRAELEAELQALGGR